MIEESMASDLEHTGEISMLYRCKIADTIRAQAARIAELEAQNKQLGDMYHKRGNDLAWAQRQAKIARADALREALWACDRCVGKHVHHVHAEIRALIDKEPTP